MYFWSFKWLHIDYVTSSKSFKFSFKSDKALFLIEVKVVRSRGRNIDHVRSDPPV